MCGAEVKTWWEKGMGKEGMRCRRGRRGRGREGGRREGGEGGREGTRGGVELRRVHQAGCTR